MAQKLTVWPRTPQQSVLAYAILWSGVTFGAGILLTWWELPAEAVALDIPEWKLATWFWLNAHGIGIAGSQVGGVTMTFQSFNFTNEFPKLHLLSVFPIVFAATVSVLVTATMGRIREKYILENCASAAIGYTIVGLGAILVSEARPGIGLLIGVMLALGLAAYVGSVLANALPIPVLAVTSIGVLILIGLFAVGSLATLAAVLMPLGKKVAIGAGMGAAALWLASNLGQ